MSVFGGTHIAEIWPVMRKAELRSEASGLMKKVQFMSKFSSVARTVLLTAALVGFGASVQAAPVVVANISDQIDVAAYSGTSNYSGHSSATFANQLRGGHYWGDSVQGASDPFNTTSIQVTRDNAAKTIQFDLFTAFRGDGLAEYADLFFDTTNSAIPNGFNFSVALGDQTKAAGVYSVGTVATSQDIWGSKTGYVYGGGFQFKTTAPGYNANFFQQSPVRLLTGTQLSNYSVSVNRIAVSGGYDLRVLITSTTNLDLFNNFDVFWGTADCSNAQHETSNPKPGRFRNG